MRNATYSMMMANPKIPAFTITSIGMGHWAVGGCVPRYRTVGKDMARQALALERQQDSIVLAGMQIIPNEYCFDYAKLRSEGFLDKAEVKNAVLYNKKLSYFEEYKYQIIGVVLAFLVLLFGFLLALYFYFRTKRFKDALWQAQKDNILILNNVNSGIKFIHPDFTIKWHNGIDYDIDPEKIKGSKGQVCYKVLRGLDEPCSFCPAVMAMKTGKVADVVVKHGNYYVYMLANPVFDDDNNLLGVVVRMEDMTKQKQAELELRKAKEKAEESDRFKSAFVANISHEIRTPLNSIVGFANLMVEEGLPEEERKLSSDMIMSNSRALLGLLDDVLDLSRLEAGMDKVFLRVCDLHFLVHSMLDIGRLNMAQGVELVNEGPREKLLVMTDEVKLTKVFMNLIGNAKKFTTQGHIVIGAKITSDGVWVECWVKDTGIGISPENLEHIFDRFYKVNEFKQGTGLGLSICEAIIELLGGQIWVESTLGKGTAFYFRIPYRKPKEEGI